MRKLATVSGFESILMFVAELNGYKSGTVTDKRDFGFSCYINNVVPHEPHEAIWCKRLYKELAGFQVSQIQDTDFYWTVPVELDVGASMLQIMGALLGDKSLLTMTNVLSDGTLNDPWGQIHGVKRSKAKMVLMRQLYGSSKSAVGILDAFDEGYTIQDIEALEAGLSTGGYGVANKFKNFLIGNCNMQPTMNPIVWGEKLVVPCNRSHRHGEKPQFYSMLDSKGTTQTIAHWKTIETPDLKSFRRWTVTGLIHGLDSQIVDFIMKQIN